VGTGVVYGTDIRHYPHAGNADPVAELVIPFLKEHVGA
jgi:hypothetical protein